MAEAEMAEAEAPDANYLRIRKQYTNSASNQQSGPFSHIVWTDSIFISVMVLNLKIKKNIVTENHSCEKT